MEEKILKFKVGGKELKLIPQKVEREDELVCDRCSYSSICDLLPDTRYPDDALENFEGLCGELGETIGGEELLNSIPAPGSLETIYPAEYFIGDKKTKLEEKIKHLTNIFTLTEFIEKQDPGEFKKLVDKWNGFKEEDRPNKMYGYKLKSLRRILISEKKCSESDIPEVNVI